MTVWGVLSCDLGAHADPYGWIVDLPVGALPHPPAGSLVRIDLGEATGISPVVLHQLTQTIPEGCRVEICGRSPSVVADAVTGLRDAFAHGYAWPGMGGIE